MHPTLTNFSPKCPFGETLTSNNPPQQSDRIIELKRMRIGDVLDHTDNWHIHPQFQTDATEGGISQIGIADRVLAYYSERNGGKLTLIDGHDRKKIDPNAIWPVLILDINDEEADYLIANLDTTTKWGQIDPLKLNELLQRAKPKNIHAAGAIKRLQEQIADQVNIAKRANGDQDATPKPKAAFDFQDQINKSVKIVVLVNDLAIVEEAIKATGKRRRGAALELLCQFYLDNKE